MREPDRIATRRIAIRLWGEDVVNIKAAIESFPNGWTVVQKLDEAKLLKTLEAHRIKGRPAEGGAEWYCSADDVAEFETAEEHIARVVLASLVLE